MLNDSPIFTILPASDRDRAKAFYSEKLGLEPSQVQANGDWSTRPAASAST